ncbi:MAG: YDG domain-containing protein [Holosporales bacterium]
MDKSNSSVGTQKKWHSVARPVLAAVCVFAMTMQGLALPQGGQVAAGDITIQSPTPGYQEITQTTDKGIINWQSFDIAKDEHVRFVQPSASSNTLNRVTGSTNPSQILGKLSANGQVTLINPNGVFFGKDSVVDVAGLTASTANIKDTDFLSGKMQFNEPGSPNAEIANEGTMTMAEAGIATLVAPSVRNDGVITAKLGTINIGGAEKFTVDLYGNGLMSLVVEDAALQTAVRNGGVLDAEGGTITLSAKAAGELVASLTAGPAVVNTGLVLAQTTEKGQQGHIKMLATDKKGDTAGVVAVSGLVSARAPTKGKGGTVQISGKTTVLENAVVDVSGVEGGGQSRIGGEYLGGTTNEPVKGLFVDNLGTPNADYTVVAPSVLVLGDALERGDGGHLVHWANKDTLFYGTIQALGGLKGGNGGFVEVSGKRYLDMQGEVNLNPQSPTGQKGTLLLDPANITISNFAPNDASVAANLRLWLDASDASTVRLTYSTNGLGTTATGTAGTNTIITAANVSANLAVGARIRLTAAGAVTTANVLGTNTYTIAAIAGTTITTVETLTTSYAAQTLFRGLVSQWNDKSTNNNNAQATAANMPLWIASNGGQNGNASLRFSSSSYMTTASNASLALSGSAYSLFSVANRINNAGLQGDLIGSGATGLGNILLMTFNGIGYSVRVHDWRQGGSPNADGTTDISVNTPFLASQVSSVTNARLEAWYNGVLENSAGFGGSTTPASPSQRITINTRSLTDSNGLNAFYGDTVIYNTELTTNSRNFLEQYQSAKWGVALTPPGTGGTEAAKAMASNGYSVFHKGYLERLSQSANIALVATNSIVINDLTANGGDGILNLATSGRTLSLTAGAGGITMNNTANTLRTNGGAISITATGGALALGNLDTTSNGATPTGAAITLSGTNISTGSITSGSNTITAIATNNITLNAGAVLSSNAAGTAITLAATGNFINNSGASPLSTPSGRWLIYSTAPGSDTLNGMTAGFTQYSCSYPGCVVTGGPTQNGFLYSSAGGSNILTITPRVIAIIYGDAAPSLTGYAFDVTGWLGGDAAVATFGANTMVATTNYSAGSNAGGTYFVNYSSGSVVLNCGSCSNSYTLAYGNNASGITVDKRTLTATLTGTVSKTYDGGTTATLATGNYNIANIYNSDNVFISNTAATYNNKNVGTGKLVTMSAPPVLSGAKAANYIITATPAPASVGTILARAVTLTAPVVSKTYDGGTSYTTTLADSTALSAALVGGDTVTAATISYGNKNAGSGNKTVTLDSVTLSDGNGGNNYIVTRAGNSTSTINKAAITITPTGQNYTYSGNTAMFDPNAWTAGGCVVGDNCNAYNTLAGYSGSASVTASDTRNAGTRDIISTGTLDFTNYDVSYSVLTNGLIIDKRALTLTVDAGYSKTYDKTTDSVGATYTQNGLQSGDSLSGGTITYDNPNAGSRTLSLNGISVNDTVGGNNYQVTNISASSTIDPRILQITTNPQGKSFGSSNPASYTYSYNAGDVMPGDSLVGALSRDPGEAVGDYTINQHTLNTNVPGNYTIVFDNTNKFKITPVGTLTVTPKPITVAYGDALNLINYQYEITGFSNGDETKASVTGSLTGTSAYTPGMAVGTPNIALNHSAGSVIVTCATCSMPYTTILYASNPSGIIVAPKVLNLSGLTATPRPYDGTNVIDAALFGSINTGVLGQTLKLSGTVGLVSANAGTHAINSIAGLGLVNDTGLASNYTLTGGSVSGQGSISKAVITIASNDQEYSYTNSNGDFLADYLGYTALGCAPTDNCTNVANLDGFSGSISLTASDVITGTGGTPRPISVVGTGGATSTNYHFVAANNGKLTITPAGLRVSYSAVRTYGSTTYTTLTPTVQGIIEGDTNIFFNESGVILSDTVGQFGNAGVYATGIGFTGGSLGGSNAGSYTFLARDPGQLTINKAPLTVTINDATRSYGQSNPNLQALIGYIGFLGSNNENNSITGGPVIASTIATPTSNPGSYAITLSPRTAINYVIDTSAIGTLFVTPVSTPGTPNVIADNTDLPVLRLEFQGVPGTSMFSPQWPTLEQVKPITLADAAFRPVFDSYKADPFKSLFLADLEHITKRNLAKNASKHKVIPTAFPGVYGRF